MTAARTFSQKADKFALMSLYEQRINRAIQKNLATLRALQAERKQTYEKELAEEVLIARYSDLNGLPYQAPAAPTQNGFVFSNQEIFTAAHRASILEIAKVTVNQLPYKVQFAGVQSASASASGAPCVTTGPEIAEQDTGHIVRKQVTRVQSIVSIAPNKRQFGGL